MMKTVKVKKQMRLDELIKYVWDNDFSVRGYMGFRSDCDNFEIRVSTHKLDYVWDNTSKFSGVPRHTTFTVEVEEEITEDTVFDYLIEITTDGGYIDHGYNISVSDVKGQHSIRFYTLINKKLEIIWEEK